MLHFQLNLDNYGIDTAEVGEAGAIISPYEVLADHETEQHPDGPPILMSHSDDDPNALFRTVIIFFFPILLRA